MTARWRVGRKLGRTLYRDQVFVGVVDTAAMALDIVDRMNGIDDSVVRNLIDALTYCRSEARQHPKAWAPAVIDRVDAALGEGAYARARKRGSK